MSFASQPMSTKPAKIRVPLDLRPLPRPGKPMANRRVNRASCTVDALSAAFNGAAKRAGCDAILLADDKGMVVSNSSTHLDLEMLAAVTPIVARGEAVATIKRQGQSRELSVRSLDILGERLHVAVLGGDERARTVELARTLAATQRILAA